ncbi:MBL fold metallo-hydrolase [Gordonia zhenghanii]|uniref:MBL fold metallo-hydrolase n=1 Tax=Gordonia zhenghanii TaxID=2911516 RepID=UPI0027DEC639|nr:MBL fold metallo-hydrolase [Gordonia zhenghanii]
MTLIPGPLRAMGASTAAIAEATDGSPNLSGGVFANREAAPVAGSGPGPGVFVDMLRRPGAPAGVIPVLRPAVAEEPAALSITWLGHATALIDVDGVRVLLDPVLSARCSPSQLVGPKRMHDVPVTAADLPPVDVVLLSHDHYDHLDTGTVTTIARTQPDALFVAPIGVDAHLRHWGVDASRIRTADWHGSVDVSVRGTSLTFDAHPARHFSGRGFTRNETLWASWGVTGPSYSFFFSGDTGFTDAYREVGDRHGAFDATLIAIGAYDPLWPDIHLNPEEAVTVHELVNGGARGSLLVPIHWGTFNLARHSWGDPVRRLLPAAEAAGVDVCVPRPGSTLDAVKRVGTAIDDPTWWERHA